MRDVIDIMHQRVQQKLSGEVLQIGSGRLYDSIQKEVTVENGQVIGRVFSDGSVSYAAIQEEGGTTSPHDIVVQNAEALRFLIGVSERFAVRVHHPGSKIPAHWYMRDTLAENVDLVKSIFSEGLS